MIRLKTSGRVKSFDDVAQRSELGLDDLRPRDNGFTGLCWAQLSVRSPLKKFQVRRGFDRPDPFCDDGWINVEVSSRITVSSRSCNGEHIAKMSPVKRNHLSSLSQ
jgi:hypothetical protein